MWVYVRMDTCMKGTKMTIEKVTRREQMREEPTRCPIFPWNNKICIFSFLKFHWFQWPKLNWVKLNLFRNMDMHLDIVGKKLG